MTEDQRFDLVTVMHNALTMMQKGINGAEIEKWLTPAMARYGLDNLEANDIFAVNDDYEPLFRYIFGNELIDMAKCS